MLEIFHNFKPQAILFSLGPINIFWYGLAALIAILTGIFLLNYLTRKEKETQDHLWSLFFYLIIFGLIGARIYHVLFYNLTYFLSKPLEIVKLWHGGLAIHGAIIAGIVVIYLYTKKNNLNIFKYTDLLTLVVPLGQAIGRAGNYFNQELFGLPCQKIYCIPISQFNRPEIYQSFTHFHPVFLYEAFLNIILFILLLLIYKYKKLSFGLITAVYLIGYSIIRFMMEYLRLDVNSTYLGLKWVQWLSILIIIVICSLLFKNKRNIKA